MDKVILTVSLLGTIVSVATLTIQQRQQKKMLSILYVNDSSFLKMKNGGDDPCKFAEKEFECIDYSDTVDGYIIED